jgi:Winged helix DNA-binding domain
VEDRSLVRGWLMRGTVHLVAADDYGWMRPLFGAGTARYARRRLGQLGMEAATVDRALGAIEKMLRADGMITRPELVDRLAAAGIEVAAETRVHLMTLAVVEGLACIGPDVGGAGSLALASDWLGRGDGGPRRFDRETALAELARMYLRAFAPASERDFAKWAGLPLGQCRIGLERIAPELVELDASLIVLRCTKLRAPRAPLVRLLPAFDTYLLGYESRAHAVDAAGERRILPGGGVLRPTICVDGRLVGLWSSKRSGDRLAIDLEPFEPLDEAVLAAIQAEVADIGRFEGLAATLVT